MIPFEGYFVGLGNARFETTEMNSYFMSLPPDIQKNIVDSGAAVATLGELMQIGEHLKHSD